MKKYIIFFFVIFLSNLANAQYRLSFDETNVGGKEQSIYTSRIILINSKNDKYILGTYKYFFSLENIILTTFLSSTVDICRGFYISKYDSLDKFKWVRKLCESDSIFIPQMCIDKEDNLTVGLSFRNKLYLENDTIQSAGFGDILILKLDTNGNELFRKNISSPCFETLNSMHIDNYNNLYFSGELEVSTIPCNIYFDNLYIQNTTNYYYAKMNKLGEFQWVSNSNSKVNSFYTFDNNLFCTGQCVSTSNTFAGLMINYPQSYLSKCFLAKLDTNGNAIWAKKFGNKYNNALGNVTPKSLSVVNNRIYVTASGSDQNQLEFLFEGGPNLIGGTASFDYAIACYDTSGNFKWNTISNSPGSEYLTELTTDTNSNVYGVGKMDYTLKFPTDTLYSYGGDDVMVCSYDSIGNFRWATNGGGSGADIGSGIAIDNNQKLYIVGGTTSSGGCVMGNDTLYPPSGQSTLFFASLDSIAILLPTKTINYYKDNANVKTYPNPATNALTVDIDKPIFNTLEITDITGKLITTQHIATNTSMININTSMLNNGMYLLSLKSEQQQVTQKIIIQH